MKEFTWTGRKEGIVVRGELESESLDDAISILKGRGIEVEELVETEHDIDESISAGSDHHQVFEHRITAPRTNALAVISLVVSLLGVIVTWFIPIITQIAAIICGHIARSQIEKSNGNQTGSGMALAGLIISYLVLIVGLLVLIILGVTIAEFASEM
ncbi:MAG: DUF4190 domain-containing protein [Arenicellales bacterium]|jgi:hypothetical protein|nr:DUF4190 domain-containing protein [Arenicellales bacterium]MDP6790383.1 DUF4190 domain-containing protein [Arenicellales bacterium]MDP6919596.1 DUF4190 domain-containing protein [Arenicellales bacterium]